MKRFLRSAWFCAALACASFAQGAAHADVHASAQGGSFVPWDGDSGYSILVNVLGGLGDGHYRIGGELEFRSFETEFFGVSNIDTDSFIARILFQRHFLLKGPLRPYIGSGLALSLHHFDESRIERFRGRFFNVEGDTSAGLEVNALAGLAIHFAPNFSIFGEARVGFGGTFVRIERVFGDDDLEFENLSGANFVGGLRLTF